MRPIGDAWVIIARAMSKKIHVDATAVRKIANLAQLGLSDDEIRTLPAELTTILEHVAQLDALESSDRPSGLGLDPRSGNLGRLREDRPSASLSSDVVARAAPESAAGFFRVPRVIRTAD